MALHKTTIEAGEVVYDSALTIGQVRKMASSEGDIDSVIEVLSAVVQTWPYEGDPSDTDSWDALTLPEFNELATAVTEDLGKALS